MSVESLNWHPFTVDQAGGYKVRDLAALHNGERPADLTLSEQEIDRRWSMLTSDVKDASTMATKPPAPTGPTPTILSREEVIKRAGAHPAPSDGPSAPSSAGSTPRSNREPDRTSPTSSDRASSKSLNPTPSAAETAQPKAESDEPEGTMEDGEG